MPQLASAMLVAVRSPAPAMLLGSDGNPMKKDAGGGGAPKRLELVGEDGLPGVPADDRRQGSAGGLIGVDGEPTSGTGTAGDNFEMPEDLADFDPTFDPLAAPRPKYDLAACSGRPNEVVWGAMAADSPVNLTVWAAHMREQGVVRMLGLFSAEDAAARAEAGSAEGYYNSLVASGFEASKVGLLDPRAEGARDAAWGVLKEAQAANERVCVHCVDGEALTGVLLADWILTDYIGGDNYEEACHALVMRKRLSGVGRQVEPESLEGWVTTGHL